MAGSDGKRSGNPATRAAASDAARHGAGATQVGLVPPAQQGAAAHDVAAAAAADPGCDAVLTLTGLYSPLPIAIPALVVAAAFVLWLAVLSWPLLERSGRLLRGVMVGLLVGAIVARLTGAL